MNKILRSPEAKPVSAKGQITGPPVLLLEFNELSPTLMDRFIAEGHLPHFKSLRDSSQVYVSDAEELAPNLEPWIQWVTVHSGLPFEQHGVFHLGAGEHLSTRSLWDIVSAAGGSVCICASMNIKYEKPINGVVIPDAWSAACAPFPEEVASYNRFVRANVQEHTNEAVGLSKVDVLRFIQFMVTHGLSFSSVRDICSQLLVEQRTGKSRWKRATILDKLQRDVFLHYFRKMKPDLSTFFLNSTAHFQHVHWRNMDPEPFTVKPTAAEQAEFSDAVLYGYKEMDGLLGDIVSAAPPDSRIILATALSQQPCLNYEDIGGKTFYRPREIPRLLEFAGISRWSAIEPVMAEQFHIHFKTEEEARNAAVRLNALRVGNRTAMFTELKGNTVFTGCCTFAALSSPEIMLEGGSDGRSIPFLRIFYQVESTKSGMHHPAGILWIRLPGMRPSVHVESVPLRAIAPTILSLLGLDVPQHMNGPVLTAEYIGSRRGEYWNARIE